MKITKSQLLQIIQEELHHILQETPKAGDLMLDPAITNWGFERLADLEAEKEKERAAMVAPSGPVTPEDIKRVAGKLIKLDKKIYDRHNENVIGEDPPWSAYEESAKAILMGHPRGWAYRTPAVEEYIKTLSQGGF